MTTFRRVSASGLDTAQKCPASFALNAVDQESGAAAVAGTGRHAFLDAFAGSWNAHHDVARARDEALATVPQDAPWRAACEGIDLVAQVEGVTLIEVGLAFAYHPETGDVGDLGPVSARDYSPPLPWVCGTLDWVAHRDGGGITLIDFKGQTEAEPAARNLQLGFYAACYAKTRNVPEMRVELRYISDMGAVRVDGADLDAWDFDATLQRVTRICEDVDAARLAAEAGKPVPMRLGTHCTYCPCKVVCPAQIEGARSLLMYGEGDLPAIPTLSAAQAGSAWVRVTNGIALLERIERLLRERALAQGGLPLPDGESLVVVSQERKSLDAAEALPILRALVGDRVEELIERSISTTVVTALGGELGLSRGQTKAAGQAAIWEALAPATKRTTTQSLRVKKAKVAK